MVGKYFMGEVVRNIVRSGRILLKVDQFYLVGFFDYECSAPQELISPDEMHGWKFFDDFDEMLVECDAAEFDLELKRRENKQRFRRLERKKRSS